MASLCLTAVLGAPDGGPLHAKDRSSLASTRIDHPRPLEASFTFFSSHRR